MSVYLAIGGVVIDQFASTKGMGDFVRLVDRLDDNLFPLLTHLVDWGWVNNLDDLELEIEKALKKKMASSVHGTIAGLQSALKDRKNNVETVILTNGLTEDDGKDGTWWSKE